MPEVTPVSFPVGSHHFECVDANRIDPQEGQSRRFMVTAFYPAIFREGAASVAAADLFAPALSEGLEALAHWHKTLLPADAISRAQDIPFAAYRELEPDRSAGPYPVLICSSPGEGDRFATAPLCIHLARQGFVVFSLDHPHDTKVVVYPDRTICATPLVNASHMLMRILDVACFVDQLDELSKSPLFHGMLDLQKIGALGHSRGGATALASTFWIDRLRAGVNLDGYLFGFQFGRDCGLEHYPESYRQKVATQEKPILRLRCTSPQPGERSSDVFGTESKVFGGPFLHMNLPGWAHHDFLWDQISGLVTGDPPKNLENQVRTLAHVTGRFFSRMLANPADLNWMKEVEAIHPGWEIWAKTVRRSGIDII